MTPERWRAIDAIRRAAGLLATAVGDLIDDASPPTRPARKELLRWRQELNALAAELENISEKEG